MPTIEVSISPYAMHVNKHATTHVWPCFKPSQMLPKDNFPKDQTLATTLVVDFIDTRSHITTKWY